nr:transposase [Gammaproteobacteria bacterium]
MPAVVWTQDWNVNCQAVPNAEASLGYLAPYVFKVTMADHRILGVHDAQVSFSYHKPGSDRPRTLTLDALEFIRPFLQHVLPSGFMKVRYYGFLSPTSEVPLEDVKAKVELAHGFYPQRTGDRLGALAQARLPSLRGPTCASFDRYATTDPQPERPSAPDRPIRIGSPRPASATLRPCRVVRTAGMPFA